MKTKEKIKIYTSRELQDIQRNYASMSVKKRKEVGVVILLALIVRTIKGKLGFDINSADGIFLFKSKAIHDALVANVSGFYTPAFALLATLATQIAAFETAIEKMANRAPGAEGIKTEAKIALFATLKSALAYVNQLAYNNQPNAVAIITEAKMMVIAPPSRKKVEFAVKQGTATGEVKLISLATKIADKRVKGIYNWQYSIDSGLTWINLPDTLVAKTIATGMAVNKQILFRKRTTTSKGGTSAWSAPLEITPV